MRGLKSLGLLTLAATCLAVAAPGLALADSYPSKPVRIVVPFPAGQSGDILARLIGEQLTKSLGKGFVIENRPGAGGTLGADVAAKAAPDGYTLVLVSNGPYAIAPAMYPRLPYSPARDLAPVARLGNTPQVLLANPSAGFSTVKEFVAKAGKGDLNYASSGNGSTQHLTMELFRTTTGIKLNHVPFKGAAEAQTQVIGGQIPILVDSVPSALQQIKASKLKAIAVTSAQRSPFLPGIPTVAEQGYPGFEAIGWFGVAAPAQTPVEILDQLNAAIRKALADPALRQRFEQLAVTPAGDETRAQFAAFLNHEIAKWGKVVKDSGATVD